MIQRAESFPHDPAQYTQPSWFAVHTLQHIHHLGWKYLFADRWQQKATFWQWISLCNLMHLGTTGSYSCSTLLTRCDVLRNLSHCIYYCKPRSSACKDPVCSHTALQETSGNIRAACLTNPQLLEGMPWPTEFCQGAQSCPGLGSPGVNPAAFVGLTPSPKLFHSQNTQSFFSGTDVKAVTQNGCLQIFPETRDNAPSPFYAKNWFLLQVVHFGYWKLHSQELLQIQPRTVAVLWVKHKSSVKEKRTGSEVRGSPNTCQSELLHLFQSIWGLFTDCFPILKLHDFQVTTWTRSVLRGMTVRNQGQRSRCWCSQTLILFGSPLNPSAWTPPRCLLPCQSCGEHRQTASAKTSPALNLKPRKVAPEGGAEWSEAGRKNITCRHRAQAKPLSRDDVFNNTWLKVSNRLQLAWKTPSSSTPALAFLG